MKGFLAFLVWLAIGLPVLGQQVSLIVPQQSTYGYHWTALAGSDRQLYVTPVAETDPITTWSGDGKVVTFTAANHLSANDLVNLRGLTSAGQNFSWQKWRVLSATSTSFTISDGTTGSGKETDAYLQKMEGANFKGTGTWEILETAGKDETYRLYTNDGGKDTGFVNHPILTNVPAHVGMTVGSLPGACKPTGTIQASNFMTHSSREFTVKFTSTDDPTVSSSFVWDVCANGGGYAAQGVAHVMPRYRQVYPHRLIPLFGQVFGNVDQNMHYEITQAPAGSDAKLIYPDSPQPVFDSGSVPGLVEIKTCPKVDPSNPVACAYSAIYISANPPPTANPLQVETIPCDKDPNVKYAMVLEIGPSQQYKTLLDIPQQLAMPLLVRVHNEGPAGKRTVYADQAELKLGTASIASPITHKNPGVTFCGVPNSNGELPRLDPTNSSANGWASKWVVGPYSQIAFNGMAGPAVNDGKVKPVNTVGVWGFDVRNLTAGVPFTAPDGTKQTWGAGIPLRPYGIQYWFIAGNHYENTAQPLFDDCNTQQSGWPGCTLDTLSEGNYGVGYGIAHQSTEHFGYNQAFRSVVALNIQLGVVPLGEGTAAYSDRGTRSFHMYNYVNPAAGFNTASGPGGHSEIQDAYNYILPDEFWGYQGSANCGTKYSTAPGCSGAFGGEDWFAAITEEHNMSEFTIGNAIESTSGGAKFLSLSTTHNTTGIDNSSQGFYSYNTLVVSPAALNGGQFFFEDTRLGTRGDPTEPFLPAVWPRADIQNNIITWKDNRTCAYTCATFGLFGHALMHFQTNLVVAGQVTVKSQIAPTGNSTGGVYQTGINTLYTFYDGWPLNPINQNLSGFISANFIAAKLYPVDLKTLQLVKGSNAVGAASQLTGQLAYYPPRFLPPDGSGVFKLRNDLTTVGAFDGTPTSGTPQPPPVGPPVSTHAGTTTPPPTRASIPAPTPPAASADPMAEWIQVGKEGETVNGKAGQTFRYGSHGGVQANVSGCDGASRVPAGWLQKTLTVDGDVTANNDTFGGDPARCIIKVIEVQKNPAP